MTDSYDHYADQLLNSAFKNARKTPAINTSHEDQLLNQLFQNARYSAPATPSPMFGNNLSSNEWFLLQQLQQQKELLERQQQMMSPSVFHQVPIQSASSPIAVVEEAPVAAPIKKIARVPVHNDPVVLEDSAVEPLQQQQLQSLNNASALPPPLNKKKSFLRSLSLKRPSNKDLAAAAVAVATTAIAAQSIQQQYNEQRREEKARKKEEQERKKQERENKKTNKRAAKLASVAAVSDYEETPEVEYQSTSQPKYVDKNPSFWKPREERPKGWWKGQRAIKGQQEQYEEVEYEEFEEEEEEEVVPVVAAPPVKTKRVVKRVAVPKPVPSIKASKPKRPMAFKQPSPRKSKPEKKKKSGKKGSQSTTNETSTTTPIAQPMYMMPQQMYYQQPMMMAPQYMPGSYYPQMMGQMPQQQTTQPERRSSPARKKSIYNPRDNSNDKCSIM